MNSTCHAPTNMANTLRELHKKICIRHCHHQVPGSEVNAQVRDIFNNGLAEYYQVSPEEIDQGNGNAELEMDDFEAI